MLATHLVWWWRSRSRHSLQVSGAKVLACGRIDFRSRRHPPAPVPAQMPWWKYALIALADVEANFLVVMAYQYTTITSVMLLDCFAIPSAMVLSFLFLGTRYTWRHYAGVGVCLAGLGLLVLSDVLHIAGGIGGDSVDPRHKWVGDLLCLAGAFLYAVSNVAQEASVKSGDRVEFLGMLGAWGALINGVQLLVVELRTLQGVVWSGATVGLVLGFGLCLFAMYVLTSHFLQQRDATLFNLSMLTSDLWGVLVGVLLFGQGLSWLYFLALVVIVAGIFLYNSADTLTASQAQGGEGDPASTAAEGTAASLPCTPACPKEVERQALLPAA